MILGPARAARKLLLLRVHPTRATVLRAEESCFCVSVGRALCRVLQSIGCTATLIFPPPPPFYTRGAERGRALRRFFFFEWVRGAFFVPAFLWFYSFLFSGGEVGNLVRYWFIDLR